MRHQCLILFFISVLIAEPFIRSCSGVENSTIEPGAIDAFKCACEESCGLGNLMIIPLTQDYVRRVHPKHSSSFSFGKMFKSVWKSTKNLWNKTTNLATEAWHAVVGKFNGGHEVKSGQNKSQNLDGDVGNSSQQIHDTIGAISGGGSEKIQKYIIDLMTNHNQTEPLQLFCSVIEEIGTCKCVPNTYVELD